MSTSRSSLLVRGAAVVLSVMAVCATPRGFARAQGPDGAEAKGRRLILSREGADARGAPGRPEGQGGVGGSWWLGTAGVVLALAAAGWASLAARRFSPANAPGATALKVVGRTSLSPKHTVYLLQAGGRVLIVGAGPQGAPSLLGELTPAEAAPAARTSPASTAHASAGRNRLDLRLGDDA